MHGQGVIWVEIYLLWFSKMLFVVVLVCGSLIIPNTHKKKIHCFADKFQKLDMSGGGSKT